MKRTLRRRVTAIVIAVIVPLLLLLAVGIYVSVRQALYRELDEGLAGRARTLSNAVEREPGGWEFEFEHDRVPAFAAAERPRAYFQIWLPTGDEVIRSESLGRRELPRRAGPMADPWLGSARLPDGQPGRLCGIRFAPRLDEDIADTEADRYRDPVVLVVAQDAGPVHEALATLRMWLGGAVALVSVLAAALVAWGVRRGLRPLETIGRRIEAIDAEQLSTRLPTQDLPDELVGPVRKLNELLERLEEAFVKERRFTADVSHELRTPLAGLRSVLEVAASRPRSAEEYRRTLQQAHDIATQLSQLADDLLTLARLDAEQLPVEPQDVELRAFAEQELASHRERAEARGITFHNEIDEGATCRADPHKLSVVLSNLLSNAVEYTDEGGWVSVSSAPEQGLVLAVEDSGPPIPQEHLPRLFERFWRGDRARAATGEHAGIGLPLAQAMCRAHGWQLVARNTDGGGVRFDVCSAEPRPR